MDPKFGLQLRHYPKFTLWPVEPMVFIGIAQKVRKLPKGNRTELPHRSRIWWDDFGLSAACQIAGYKEDRGRPRRQQIHTWD